MSVHSRDSVNVIRGEKKEWLSGDHSCYACGKTLVRSALQATANDA